MIKYPFLSLKAVNAPYEEEIRRAVADTVGSGRYIGGGRMAAFEAALAAQCGAGHVVACSNGLDALRLILRAYKEMGVMEDGDEVVVQANTYVASVLAITDSGLRPVLVDADEATLNLDFSKVEERITPRTRAIMVVHLYGSPCWSPELVDMARRHNLKILEDNAQAIGARTRFDGLNGSHATGCLGDAAAFSFYPTKNVGAMGDAGAVGTCDVQLAATVRALANYGSDRRYHNVYRGLNCRMDEVQAAVLGVKLRHLDEITRARRERAAAYDRAIDNPAVVKPRVFEGDVQVWHQYEIRVTGGLRDAFRAYLLDNGVETDVHYATPPHRQPCYSDLADTPLPVTDRLAGEYVSLPISETLPLEGVAEIAGIINRFRG